ncbi:hypothetical protein B484DRAFT_447003 [Ochromonadaceae sp. CCMP2298]|nr:hypothetical protein B484DRAFT_447003 [Ochromonadaceae sp. CCMP2298]
MCGVCMYDDVCVCMYDCVCGVCGREIERELDEERDRGMLCSPHRFPSPLRTGQGYRGYRGGRYRGVEGVVVRQGYSRLVNRNTTYPICTGSQVPLFSYRTHTHTLSLTHSLSIFLPPLPPTPHTRIHNISLPHTHTHTHTHKHTHNESHTNRILPNRIHSNCPGSQT